MLQEAGEFVRVELLDSVVPSYYVQFILAADGALCAEAVSNANLDSSLALAGEQLAALEELGWRAPEKRGANWSTTITSPSSESLDEMVTLVQRTFREAYGVSDEKMLTVTTSWQDRNVKATETQKRREGRASKLESRIEQLSKRVLVVGKDGVGVEFDGVATITVRRGLFAKTTRAVDKNVSAVVESAGNLRTHPTLTRTIAGFAVTGTPIGAASWKKSGSLFLLIDGRDWAELVELNPKKARDAQKFAQQVNLAARTMGRPDNPLPPSAQSSPVSSDQVIEQLERLVNLRDAGALTQEEFDAEKRRVLDR